MDSFLSLIIGLILGISLYYLDLKRGIKWFRSWYNLTHEKPSKEPLKKGFIHQQAFSGKFILALIISIIIAVVLYLSGSLNLFVILLSCAIIMAAMIIGFYAGPLVFTKLVPKIEDFKDVLEKIDVLEEKLINKEHKEVSIEPENEKKKTDPDPPKKEDKDWRGGVKDFLDK